MKTVSLSGSLRGNVGKKDAKQNRRNGNIPCVLYGGKSQLHFLLSEKETKPFLFSTEVFRYKITIDGTQYDAILQDAQFHPVSDSVYHIDFLEVIPDKPVKLSLPLRLIGTPAGVFRGGKLVKKFRKLKVMGLIDNIPDAIETNISHLEILDVIKISDIKVDNLTVLDPPGSLVVTVQSTRTVAAEPVQPGASKTEPAKK